MTPTVWLSYSEYLALSPELKCWGGYGIDFAIPCGLTHGEANARADAKDDEEDKQGDYR